MFVHRLEEQQNLASNWYWDVERYNDIPEYAETSEVRDVDNHMSVCNLQRLQDVHFIISDVDDRQQTFRERSCENTDLFY